MRDISLRNQSVSLKPPFALNNLWGKNSFIELSENHRQGTAKLYADILNRVRFGEYFGDMLFFNQR